MPLHGSFRAQQAGIPRTVCITIVVLACLAGSLSRVQAAPMGQSVTPGETIFQTKCAACHTVGGGKLVGPDLQGVTAKRDPAWLKAFIATPDKVLASGDPIAAQLLKEYNNIPMPNQGLTAQEVDALITFLATKGGSVPAAPVGGAPTPAASAPAAGLASPGSADHGVQLFSGAAGLKGGGTACIACHSVEGVGALGGGALGPDLTHVYARYGRAGLTAALGSLPFPSMQGIYATRQLTPDEQADLLAFFAAADRQGEPRPSQNLLLILGGGTGLAGVLFLGMTLFWPRQRLSIAQRLRKYGKL